MKTRKLGHTDLQISEIGFGTWGLGGDSYGEVDNETSLAALRKSIHLGINFYDTSDLYGDGRCETILGEAIRGHRDSLVICTKGGMLPHSGFVMPQDFSQKHLTKACEASLNRLGLDCVDLYLLHSPTREDVSSAMKPMETLAMLQKAGKIKYFGISARSPEDALHFIQNYQVSAIEINFNLIDQRALSLGLFDLAQKKGVGLICRTPLCFGFLTGKLSGQEIFSQQDHRRNWPKRQLELWSEAPELFKQVNNDGSGRTMTQFALKYCLNYKAFSTVIPGMMNTQEVLENATTDQLANLSENQIQEIEKIYKSHIFYEPKLKAAEIEKEREKLNS